MQHCWCLWAIHIKVSDNGHMTGLMVPWYVVLLFLQRYHVECACVE